ncbi:MAG: N-formylkynurenine (Aryl-) formamidase (EC [uncultured Aureispira sp.]|uniref:N-formylkynurenine (Aryl-) formamidase (EC) n=1 Tax=uncultured Aureispira sp. TaxID=1331704 RepID=A0A6S6UAU9_9BACT|nr:MAG: N-formylkynurenine (Aryl-) formamidase (EC [uncultured Aureispira sp.]
MKTTIQYQNKNYVIDLDLEIDISLPIQQSEDAASAWYCPPSEINPVMTEHFVGSVRKGGAVNFNNISFNPHGNGTHTECVGHISKAFYSIHQLLKRSFFLAQLVTIEPKAIEGDQVITLEQLKGIVPTTDKIEALVLRTLPNSEDKKRRQYTNTNPPFVEAKAMNWLYEQGIRHFLIDTPSVDKEVDGGALAAHHAYWNYPENPRLDATITELIYVPNEVKDNLYFLNLQTAAFENDATPSKPILYTINS